MRLRPSVPRSARTVRAAVRIMCAGAAITAVNLIIMLADIGGIKAAIRNAQPSLTAAQVSQQYTSAIMVGIFSGAVVIAVWLLWCPASSAFFRPPGYTQALHQAQMAELTRIRSSTARLSRPW
jgi:hypothetical protein